MNLNEFENDECDNNIEYSIHDNYIEICDKINIIKNFLNNVYYENHSYNNDFKMLNIYELETNKLSNNNSDEFQNNELFNKLDKIKTKIINCKIIDKFEYCHNFITFIEQIFFKEMYKNFFYFKNILNIQTSCNMIEDYFGGTFGIYFNNDALCFNKLCKTENNNSLIKDYFNNFLNKIKNIKKYNKFKNFNYNDKFNKQINLFIYFYCIINIPLSLDNLVIMIFNVFEFVYLLKKYTNKFPKKNDKFKYNKFNCFDYIIKQNNTNNNLFEYILLNKMDIIMDIFKLY